MRLIKLTDVTKRTRSGRDVYVLPGRLIVQSAFAALNILDDLHAIAKRSEQSISKRAAQNIRVSKTGAVITRNQSGNKRYFLGV